MWWIVGLGVLIVHLVWFYTIARAASEVDRLWDEMMRHQ
jgi:hypothetical protein